MTTAVQLLDAQLAERVNQAEDQSIAAARPLLWFRERAVAAAHQRDFDMVHRLMRIAMESAAICAAGKGPEPTLQAADHYQGVADILEVWLDDQ